MFDFKKISIFILLLSAFCAFELTAKEKEDKNTDKTEVEPEKKKCSKTDSLSEFTERAVVKDSLNQNKHNVPSSMSSMSYNILFQVIYRYSFKEIFDSPAASEIVTN